MTNRQTQLLAAIRNGCEITNGYDAANLLGGTSVGGASTLRSLRSLGLIKRGEFFAFVVAS